MSANGRASGGGAVPADLRAAVRGAVRIGEPLAPHTTLRIGGPADWFVVPRAEADLAAAFAWAGRHGLASWALGNGSNLLVPDDGVRGLVVTVAPACEWVRWGADAVEVGAGYSTQRLLNEAARRGLAGLEGLSGVPGTFGGALVMNAGTAAGETATAVESVRVLLPSGEIAVWGPPDLAFGYRSSRLQEPGCVALSARLRLRPADPAGIRREVEARGRRRKETQPLQLPSAGSIWTNPPGDHAGRLVEAAGCKGMRIGGAQVSTKHANFIVNVGGARAEDVITLMANVRRRVRQSAGIRLEPEIRWMRGQTELLALLDSAAS